MFVVGIGTAAPVQRFTQLECWEALQSSHIFTQLKPRSRAILKKVLRGQNGIATRHLALTPIAQGFEMTPDALQGRFSEHAPALAAAAAARALTSAGCRADEIDAVIVSTCTGYLCPGLTSYVSQRLGLRPDVFNLDLVGQGCGAALPNMRAGDAILAAGRAQNVLSVCVEVCSAAVYLDDDPGVLVSACLFGDGAGAAVLSREPRPAQPRVEWKSAASCLLPEHRDILRFTHCKGMLRNTLLPQVPDIAGREVAKLFDRTLASAGINRDSIVAWILHTGGRDVLQSLRDHLILTEFDVRHSAAVLSEFGNISSPTVYFVLERALGENVPDGLWWMSAFGAGFSCHGALLEVTHV